MKKIDEDLPASSTAGTSTAGTAVVTFVYESLASESIIDLKRRNIP